MAIMKNGLLYGRVGNQLYYVRGGVQHVRALIKKQKRLPSPKQVQQFERMRQVNSFLSPLKQIIRHTCEPDKGLMSGMNRAMQQIFRAALVTEEDGKIVIDPALVKVSMGSLANVYVSKVEVLNGIARIEWIVNPFLDYYPVYLLAYNVEQQIVQLSSGGDLSSQGLLTMELNEEIKTGLVHLYVYTSDRQRAAFSDSTYAGSISCESNDQ
ncbi:MAG TPA: hypothetical protein VN040_12235 [Pseudosphingobacterium sp.]|nr:hypothetical protein [Pseudosphingobacterium sp.]